MHQTPRVQVEDARIESWKQIASFFGRDERTVKRWERERALPVHRLPGERGGVFAYTLELNEWRNSRASRKAEAANAAEKLEETPVPLPPETLAGAAVSPRTFVALPVPDLFSSSPTLPAPAQATPANSTANWIRILALGLAGICGIVALPYLARAMRGVVHSHAAKPAAAEPKAEAKESYLMGRYYWDRRTDGSLKLAVDAFTQAVVQDPGYARAYAGLAESYELMPQYSTMPNAQAFPRAITAAQRAVQLDASLAEAHRALAFGQFFWEWRVKESMAEYRKAILLDPNDVEGHHWYATALLSLGHIPEAKTEIERARELDPASRSVLTDGALIGYSSGAVQQSIEKLRAMEIGEPDFVAAPRYLARMLLEQRDYPGFIRATQHAARISGSPLEQAIADAASRGWAKGGRNGMLQAMRTVQQQALEQGQTSGFDLAHTCAMLGEREAAVTALQGAYEVHDYMLMTIIHGDMQTLLQGYPPFEALKLKVLARMNG